MRNTECGRRGLVLLAAAVVLAAGSAAQAGGGLGQRLARLPDGDFRMTFTARPGVCGNGRGLIMLGARAGDCLAPDGTVARNRVTFWTSGSMVRSVVSGGRGRRWVGGWNDGWGWSDGWRNGGDRCSAGPVRVRLTIAGGRVTGVRTVVGAAPAGDSAVMSGGDIRDLGTVPAAEASRVLASAATSMEGGGRSAEEALVGAALADSGVPWPEMLSLARDARIPRRTRSQAMFWLGRAAAARIEGRASLFEGVDDSTAEDDDVKASAILALAQLPPDEAVPALIGIARTHRTAGLRRDAIFWLGESVDPRAVSLFEEVLLRR